ncbi:hypothetical protein [Umezawaea sp.]|uniref:hypothetical protein n=1 Tax=Umezawaea sp. TaxID=1955258 RepID=UPI002ED116A6
MQRPTTTGRRHDRAGSITVEELIRKQPIPIRIPSVEEADTNVLVQEVLGLEEAKYHRRPNRAAKAAGLVTGALVLVASVAAASILAGKRPEGPAEPPVAAPIELSGSTALRPDLLSARLGNERPTAPAAETGGPTSQPSASAEPNAPLAADPVTASSAPPTQPAAAPPPVAPVAPTPRTRIDVVRDFYELLPAKPAEAARLLTADLVGANPVDFIRSWSTIKAITVEGTSPQPDGSVLAEVSMQELDGRWLRVQQRFWFADTSTPKITATELLSAQRS